MRNETTGLEQLSPSKPEPTGVQVPWCSLPPFHLPLEASVVDTWDIQYSGLPNWPLDFSRSPLPCFSQTLLSWQGAHRGRPLHDPWKIPFLVWDQGS